MYCKMEAIFNSIFAELVLKLRSKERKPRKHKTQTGLNSEIDISHIGTLIRRLYNSDMSHAQLDCPLKETLINVHLEINSPEKGPDLYVQAKRNQNKSS